MLSEIARIACGVVSLHVCMYNGTNVTAGSNVGNKKNYRTYFFLLLSFILFVDESSRYLVV